MNIEAKIANLESAVFDLKKRVLQLELAHPNLPSSLASIRGKCATCLHAAEPRSTGENCHVCTVYYPAQGEVRFDRWAPAEKYRGWI